MHIGNIFAFILLYSTYFTIIGGICLYFAPTLITAGYNGDYQFRTFFVNIFGFLIFPWFIALGMAFRKD